MMSTLHEQISQNSYLRYCYEVQSALFYTLDRKIESMSFNGNEAGINNNSLTVLQ